MTASSWSRSHAWGLVDRPEAQDHGGRLYAAPLTSGEIVVIEGPAAVVARAALAGLDTAEIRRVAAAHLGVTWEDIDEEVVGSLLDQLVVLGLLTEV